MPLATLLQSVIGMSRNSFIRKQGWRSIRKKKMFVIGHKIVSITPFLHKSLMDRPEIKPRPIKLEAHILAYLGDFMSIFEVSVKRLAINTLKPHEPSPGDQ